MRQSHPASLALVATRLAVVYSNKKDNIVKRASEMSKCGIDRYRVTQLSPCIMITQERLMYTAVYDSAWRHIYYHRIRNFCDGQMEDEGCRERKRERTGRRAKPARSQWTDIWLAMFTKGFGADGDSHCWRDDCSNHYSGATVSLVDGHRTRWSEIGGRLISEQRQKQRERARRMQGHRRRRVPWRKARGAVDGDGGGVWVRRGRGESSSYRRGWARLYASLIACLHVCLCA